MSALSDYAENKVLDAITGTTTFTAPTNVYLGLSTASMADDDSGTELSGSGYARVSVSFSAASGGTTSNSAAIEFSAATGSWGSVSHWALYDALTGGNQLLNGAFSAAKTIASGDVLKINTGDLDITAA